MQYGVGQFLRKPLYTYLTVSLVEYVGSVARTVHPLVEDRAWRATRAAGDVLTVYVVGVTAEGVSESR